MLRDYAIKQTIAIVQRLDPERRERLLAPKEPRRTKAGDWHPALFLTPQRQRSSAKSRV